jgi:TolA-binding protein
MSARPGLLAVVALPLLLGAQEAPAPKAPKAVSLEQGCFELADQVWKTGAYDVAAEYLAKYLAEHPSSTQAPEAGYRLGAAYLLLGKTAEAKTAFEKLVADHFPSPWAQLALTAHYDEDSLVKLADAKRKRAREARRPEEAREALKVLELHAHRFPQGARSKEEMAYRLGDCSLLAGSESGFQSAMTKVTELDKDGDWGKLAAIRLAGAAAIPGKMDELVRLGAGEHEQDAVFLDLAEQALPRLKGDDLIKCLYYKARCLPQDRKEQRLELYRRIVKDYPASPWAAECAFWLAEAQFADKEFDKARAAYLDLAAKYPHSPRAAQARRWAGWLGERDATGKELARVLGGLVRRLADARGGFAFRLQAGDSAQGKKMAVRFAYQGRTNDGYLSIRFGDTAVLLANNKDGFWYQPVGRPELVKAPRTTLPRPSLVAKTDPANNQLSFGMGVTSDEKAEAASPFQVSADVAPALTALVQAFGHVRVEKRHAGGGPARTVIVVQVAAASWDATEPATIEVELGPKDRLAEVRGTWARDGGRTITATIADIVLGDTLPEAAFAVAVPAGVTVRTVEAFNMMELWADGMRLFAMLGQQVKNDLKK